MNHICKQSFNWVKKEKNADGEIANSQLKITETVCLAGWEFAADNSQNGGYITRHWNLMNSY